MTLLSEILSVEKISVKDAFASVTHTFTYTEAHKLTKNKKKKINFPIL